MAIGEDYEIREYELEGRRRWQVGCRVGGNWRGISAIFWEREDAENFQRMMRRHARIMNDKLEREKKEGRKKKT